MYAEVLTFQRVAYRTLLNEGGLAAPQLDAGGRLLLLARAVGDVRSQLKEWGRVTGSVDFLNELMATIDELKHCECEPEMLTGRAKFEDLRLIWEGFEAHIAQTAADPRDLLTRVGSVLNIKGSIASSARLYIDGFVSFTAQEYGIIKAFIKHGSVTVSLPAGDDDEVYKQPNLTAERIKQIATSVGANIVRPRAHTVCPYNAHTSVYSCPDMLSECDHAAALVSEWIAKGVKRGDIAVVSPAWDEYRSVLLSAFARMGILIFADDVLPVSAKSVSRFITSSLQAALLGFEPDDVIALVKTGLAPVTSDEGWLLEDYIRTHNAKGVFWTADKPWTAHPSGWGARDFSELDMARLETLNQIRKRLHTPLIKLRRAMSKNDTGENFTRALYEYCVDMELTGALIKRCEYLSEQGADREADEYRQLWSIIIKAFDNFVDILGNVSLKPDEFIRLFDLCISQYEVGTIPVTLDRVQVCALDRLYRRELKYLIVVGANEDNMPMRTNASGLLTDEERVELEQHGIDMAPRADERASRELYTIHKAFKLPSETLAITYNTAGKAEMSVFIEELDAETEVLPPQADSGETDWHSDRTPPKNRKALLPPSGALSASRIECYSSCRWAYFSRYGLRLKKRGAPGPAPKDAGSMIHAVLEFMVSEIMTLGGFKTAGRDTALEYAAQAADAWLKSLPDYGRENARVRALTTRLKQSALQVAGNVFDELSVSDFQPLATEYKFSTGQQPVSIAGIIDRIDGWIQDDRLYLRVVDYKTGRAKFSLRDVWYGLGMQMLCYLFALDTWKGQPTVPAGVLYLPSHDRFAQVGANVTDAEVSQKLHALLKRSGIILSDPAVIAAMEKSDEKLFIPVKFKQDGTVDARSQVADAARLGLLRRHVEDTMKKLFDSITRGAVDANPVCRSADEIYCKYCDYADACYRDDSDNPRFLKNVNIWEEISSRGAFCASEGESYVSDTAATAGS
jgi:ATP-dependent helicase/nuclease subunit B